MQVSDLKASSLVPQKILRQSNPLFTLHTSAMRYGSNKVLFRPPCCPNSHQEHFRSEATVVMTPCDKACVFLICGVLPWLSWLDGYALSSLIVFIVVFIAMSYFVVLVFTNRLETYL